MDKIILLDLNYTLAEQTGMNPHTFQYDVSKDVYRKDLVEAISGKRIFMITARTDNYEDETRKKIEADTGLKIERFYFKPIRKRFMKVHDFKKSIVLQLLEEGFSPDDFFGIESNANTRASYKSIGVDSCPYTEYMKRFVNNEQKETEPVQNELF